MEVGLHGLLKANRLFAELTADELREITGICHPVIFPTRKHIFTEGDKGDCLLIIETGQVDVFCKTPAGQRVDLGTVGPGAILGEMALVDGGPRSATAVARSKVEAYRMDRTDFQRLRARMAPAAFKLYKNIALAAARRLRYINARIMELTAARVGPEEPQARPPALVEIEEPERRSLLSRILGWY